MKKILLIEQYPLVAIVMKDLIQDVYPSSSLHVVEGFGGVSLVDFEVVIADLYCPLQGQLDLIHQIQGQATDHTLVFFSGNESQELKAKVDEVGGLLVPRSAQYRDIVHAMISHSGLNKQAPTRQGPNLYQSQVHHPGAAKPLTLKQVEVMEYCVQGLTNKEIGRLVGLSPETVRAHLKQAYVRLGASTRSGAVKNFLEAKRMADRLG